MHEPEQLAEHCGSYYAATATGKAEYPVLQGACSTDVCIVGAGFTGIAAALTLAERGYSVVVLDANRVGWGASGRNGGQLIGGMSGEGKLARACGDETAEPFWEMRWLGHDIIFDRVAKYEIPCDLKNGYIDVAIKPRHLRTLEKEFATLQRRSFPYEFRLTDREETQYLAGTAAYIGGLLNMRNGHLHPLNLCIGEARAAAGLGARIYEHSPVTDIRHGEKPRVLTASGYVDANAVVLAGNAYHRLERKCLSGLTFPAGSFIIATEPLSADIVRHINPLDLAICDMNELVDYYRMSRDGRMLFGGRCNYSGRQPRSIQAALRPRMIAKYPGLAEARIEFEWGGKIGVNINRVPLIGRVDGNLYYAQGYAGHGLNMTHIAGEIIADAIGGTMERLDVFQTIRHLRFPLGQRIGNQAVALAMLYYRLRDLL